MAFISPDTVQILLVEMQESVVAASGTQSSHQLRRGAAALRLVARAANLPITAAAVPLGDDRGRLIDELSDLEPLVRSTVSALGDPEIVRRLTGHGRKVLALAGVSSEIAILHTALDALAAGYEVHLLVDLCGGLDARSEAAALTSLWQAGAKPSNFSSFVTGLFASLTDELGGTVMGALAAFWGWDPHIASS